MSELDSSHIIRPGIKPEEQRKQVAMFDPVINVVHVSELKVGDVIIDVDFAEFKSALTKVTAVSHFQNYSIINNTRSEKHYKETPWRMIPCMIEILKIRRRNNDCSG